MWSYILKRVLLMIPTLFGVMLITFIIIQFVPGGPVEQMVAQLQGRDASGAGEGPAPSQGVYRGRQGVDAARVEEIKKLYGFDKPAPERFVKMLGQFARFDLGKSFFHNKELNFRCNKRKEEERKGKRPKGGFNGKGKEGEKR